MRRSAFGWTMLLAVATATGLQAQVRPVDPVLWRAFDGTANVLVSAGLGMLDDQPITLTGTRGRFEELGLYSITWRTGRVALTAAGTAYLRLTHEKQLAAPHAPVPGSRHDAGPVSVEAAARLTPAAAPVLGMLRFGTRLPVTSDESGLDRDQTDFFATLGAHYTRQRLWLAAEGGVSINGRPEPDPGQKDVFIYATGAGFRHDVVDVDVWVVGRDDLHSYSLTGHEDLRELRVGLRSRGRLWVGAHWIRGLSDWSPGHGLRIAAGVDGNLSRVPVLGWQ